MDFGIATFVTDYSMGPAALAEAVEARGFECLLLPEHSHIPASRKSPWGGGAELPKPYYDAMDPFVALGAAAAATTTLKLGTGICLVVQRDPIQLAKEIATLDRISGGRFLFGVGGGWNAEEMADHGTVFKTRYKLMAERIEAMKVIWAEEKAEYHGEFVDFEPMMAWPKPAQLPHPPIIMGGNFPYGARRAVAYGDEWMPISSREQDIVDLLPQFRDMATEAGRDPDRIPVTAFAAPPKPEILARLRDGGIARAVLMLPTVGADEALPKLDQFAELARGNN